MNLLRLGDGNRIQDTFLERPYYYYDNLDLKKCHHTSTHKAITMGNERYTSYDTIEYRIIDNRNKE